MAIRQLQLLNFSAFSHTQIDFCPGINVLIGKNGCGKTQLMKAGYVLHRALLAKEDTSAIARRFQAVFLPDHLGRLVQRRKGGSTGAVYAAFDEGSIAVSLTTRKTITTDPSPTGEGAPSVFIPSREVLAMYPGFMAAYLHRELAFDETYYDACVALSAAPLRGPRGERAKALATIIERTLEGRVQFEGDRFYLKRKDGSIEAPLVSEGFRKLASIAHLILNGSVGPNGILFWDEPEANLSPALIAQVVVFMRKLAEFGVQIVLATHDHLLTRRLSLETEYKTDKVETRFFSLFRSTPGGEIELESARTLPELVHNPILDEYAGYFDYEQQLAEAVIARKATGKKS